MQLSIPTIGIENFFEYHLEIRMHTINVTLLADLNDHAQRKPLEMIFLA